MLFFLFSSSSFSFGFNLIFLYFWWVKYILTLPTVIRRHIRFSNAHGRVKSPSQTYKSKVSFYLLHLTLPLSLSLFYLFFILFDSQLFLIRHDMLRWIHATRSSKLWAPHSTHHSIMSNLQNTCLHHHQQQRSSILGVLRLPRHQRNATCKPSCFISSLVSSHSKAFFPMTFVYIFWISLWPFILCHVSMCSLFILLIIKYFTNSSLLFAKESFETI